MAFFEPLRKIADVFIKLNANDIVFEVIGNDKELQDEILDLNKLDQLFKQGIDSKGFDLNKLTQSGFGYAESTKKRKRRKGLPTDHVTLFDTGKFYKTFRLVIAPTYLEIIANPIKPNANLFDDFGRDIVGLTEESRNILVNKMMPRIIEILKTNYHDSRN